MDYSSIFLAYNPTPTSPSPPSYLLNHEHCSSDRGAKAGQSMVWPIFFNENGMVNVSK